MSSTNVNRNVTSTLFATLRDGNVTPDSEIDFQTHSKVATQKYNAEARDASRADNGNTLRDFVFYHGLQGFESNGSAYVLGNRRHTGDQSQRLLKTGFTYCHVTVTQQWRLKLVKKTPPSRSNAFPTNDPSKKTFLARALRRDNDSRALLCVTRISKLRSSA